MAVLSDSDERHIYRMLLEYLPDPATFREAVALSVQVIELPQRKWETTYESLPKIKTK